MEKAKKVYWRDVQRKNFTKIDSLLDFLEIKGLNREKVLKKAHFPLNLPFRLAEKIQKNCLDDPIFRQFVPLEEERVVQEGFLLDPVSDQRFQKTPKLLQKYQGRALLLVTSGCAMNCRFCFRQNFPYSSEEKSFEKELAYLASDPSLSEVILSGGDPLSLSDEKLEELFLGLDKIPHIKRIRFHTRFPIGIPERIDDSFLAILKKSEKQIYFLVHVNHPKELDSEVLSSLRKVLSLPIPVLSQTVLLKGINDDVAILKELFEKLVDHGILPYYLHAFDLIQGGGHFLVEDEKGKKLVQELQKVLSGYALPRFVREKAGEYSKTIISI